MRRDNLLELFAVERADFEAANRCRPLLTERRRRGHHDRRQREVVAHGRASQDLEARLVEPIDVLADDRDFRVDRAALDRAQCRPHHLAAADRRLELEQRRRLAEQLRDARHVALVETDPEHGLAQLDLARHRG